MSNRLVLVKQLLGLQLLITLLLPAAALNLSQVAAYSALLGSLTALIPSAVFALQLFWTAAVPNARQVLQGLYVAEVAKILITATLFALVFIYVQPLDVLMLMVGFAAVLSASWLMLIFSRVKTSN